MLLIVFQKIFLLLIRDEEFGNIETRIIFKALLNDEFLPFKLA